MTSFEPAQACEVASSQL